MGAVARPSQDADMMLPRGGSPPEEACLSGRDAHLKLINTDDML